MITPWQCGSPRAVGSTTKRGSCARPRGTEAPRTRTVGLRTNTRGRSQKTPTGTLIPVVLAIDQGTTGSTCIVFDERMEPVGRAYREFAQHFPRPGWVEHDLGEIWEVTHAVAGEALADAGVRPGELEAVGITNQRETVCVWDPATGEPLHRAIVWQDRRTAARCDELREGGLEGLVRARTGLVLDPYFSATKNRVVVGGTLMGCASARAGWSCGVWDGRFVAYI